MTDLRKVTSLEEPFWAQWRDMKPLIEKALEHADEYTLGDVLHWLHIGEWQGWYTANAVACTRIAQYPRHRACIVVLAAGDLDEIVSAEPQIVEFARENGCKYIEIFGRSGWRRALEGYSEQFTVLRKEVP